MSDVESGPPSSVRRAAKRKPAANGHPDPMQDLLHALQAMRGGDFSVRMTGDHLGIEGKIADTFNEIVAANQRMAQQLERVGQVVGREGKPGNVSSSIFPADRGRTWRAPSIR